MTVFLPINEAALEGSDSDSSQVPKQNGWNMDEHGFKHLVCTCSKHLEKPYQKHLWCECLIHFASAVLVTSAFNPGLYSIAILAIHTKMEKLLTVKTISAGPTGTRWPAYPSSIGLHKWCFPCGSISCRSKQQIVRVSEGQLSEKSRKT